MKLKSTLLLAFALLACGLTVSLAQNDFMWPEDRATAEEKNALYTDLMKTKQWDKAIEPLRWLHINAPQLNPSIYIHGAKVYEELAKKAPNAQTKQSYQDSVMSMFDKRLEYISPDRDDHADVKDRKAYAAFKFYYRTPAKYAEVFKMYEEAFAANGNKIGDYNLKAYMILTSYYYKYRPGALTDQQVLGVYFELLEIIDVKVANGRNVGKLEAQRDKITETLIGTITVDCILIQDKLGERFRQNTEDIKLAKLLVSLALEANCTDQPVFEQAAQLVIEKEPSFGIVKELGDNALKRKDFKGALKWYSQAVGMTDDNRRKGSLYLTMAKLNSSKIGNRIEARKLCYKAVEEDPSALEAYTVIGNMYFSSYDQCKGNKSIVQDRAVFIAAYEMFRRAGNSSAMAQAKAQFPSREEIFTETFKAGDELTVGCWINEKVKLDTRD